MATCIMTKMVEFHRRSSSKASPCNAYERLKQVLIYVIGLTAVIWLLSIAKAHLQINSKNGLNKFKSIWFNLILIYSFPPTERKSFFSIMKAELPCNQSWNMLLHVLFVTHLRSLRLLLNAAILTLNNNLRKTAKYAHLFNRKGEEERSRMMQKYTERSAERRSIRTYEPNERNRTNGWTNQTELSWARFGTWMKAAITIPTVPEYHKRRIHKGSKAHTHNRRAWKEKQLRRR